ncbi:MAG: FHA domain-containing protein [Chloroflexota bacterium]|nr:FHA domain-containing protein [Chloroflexota bacterium]
MKNVYLSYHPSARARAEELRRILRAQGYRPWIDRSPVAGQAWHVEMDAAIRHADALVILLTDEAVDSIYLTYEFAYALGGNLPVFAIIYDDVLLHPSLLNVERFDARSFSDENHFWDHFIGEFRRVVDQARARPTADPPAPQPLPDFDKSVMPNEPGFWIVIRSGPIENAMFQLEKEIVTLGRDSANDIVIGDPQVSRYHLRLLRREANYHIEDLGSTNGLRIAGKRIGGPAPLKDGDIIALGDSIALSYEIVYP